LEYLEAEVDINRVRKTIRVEVKILTKENLGRSEFRKHKPWFDEGCRLLLECRKDAKLLGFEHPREILWDNLNNIAREPDRLSN
jgi:hypothetical protein